VISRSYKACRRRIAFFAISSLFQNDMKSFAVIPAKAGIQKRTWIPGRFAFARNDKYLLPFILKEAQFDKLKIIPSRGKVARAKHIDPAKKVYSIHYFF
jgi:hypothetical protein